MLVPRGRARGVGGFGSDPVSGAVLAAALGAATGGLGGGSSGGVGGGGAGGGLGGSAGRDVQSLNRRTDLSGLDVEQPLTLPPPVRTVPGPVAGAGLPAMLALSGYGWWRRRRSGTPDLTNGAGTWAVDPAPARELTAASAYPANRSCRAVRNALAAVTLRSARLDLHVTVRASGAKRSLTSSVQALNNLLARSPATGSSSGALGVRVRGHEFLYAAGSALRISSFSDRDSRHRGTRHPIVLTALTLRPLLTLSCALAAAVAGLSRSVLATLKA
jgi:hypothetical protein